MTSDQVKEVTTKLLEQFRNPEDLPEKLAFLYINMGRWSARWSAGNQLIAMIYEASDAATYKTWGNLGRQVNKGAESFSILKPLKRSYTTTDDDGKEVRRSYIYGFGGHNVFRLEDTKITDQEVWDKFADNKKAKEFMSEAEEFFAPVLTKLELKSFEASNTQGSGAAAWYSHKGSITMGVESLQVTAHELVHAIEHKLGNLTIAPGQQPDNELVAELGSAVMLNLMGHEDKVDLGFTYEYLTNYANGKDLTKTCLSLLYRVDAAMKFALV